MPEHQPTLGSLLDAWMVAREEGRELSPAELCASHPDLQPILERQIAALRQMNGLLQTGPDHTHPIAGWAADPGPFPTLPGYEVLGELGRGGMGVVYQARQTGLNRVVALKMVLAGHRIPDDARARFLREAEAIAKVKHPGIVQVFDFGTHEGSPYYAMEFCEGGSLAHHLGGNPLSAREAASLAERIAQAVQAAHEAGVVHRDLKPQNVLLAHKGTGPLDPACLRVSDFGLVKRLDEGQSSGQTQTGAIMGTPSYMAPEQAEGKKDVGPPADVYALGAILYECLTGRPPFRAATPLDTIRQVAHDDPVPPSRLVPGVPADLEAVCLKCLEKSPHRRYASAAELAEDLRRWGAGEPTSARPVGPLGRAARWAARHPAWAALYAVSALALALLLGGLWFSARLSEAQAEKRTIAAEKREAEAREEAARVQEEAQRFLSLTSAARESIARSRPGWTWDALKKIEQAARLPAASRHLAELRSDAVACLTAIDARRVGEIGRGLKIESLAWSPDGRTIAIGRRAVNAIAITCEVTLVSPDGKGKVRALSAPTEGRGGVVDFISALAFSRDGRTLAAGTRAGRLHRWDLTRPEAGPKSRRAHKGAVHSLVFGKAPGNALFSGGKTKVCRWGPDGRFQAETPPEGVSNVAIHPTEGWVGVESGGSLLRLSARHLKPLGPPVQKHGFLDRIAFAPDGRGLVGWDGTLGARRHDGRVAWRDVAARNEDLECLSVEAGAGGALALAAVRHEQDRHALLYDAVSGRQVARCLTTADKPEASFSPDGRRFVVNEDDHLTLYEVGGLREQTFAALRSDASVRGFRLSPDGRLLVCERLGAASPWAGEATELSAWETEEGAPHDGAVWYRQFAGPTGVPASHYRPRYSFSVSPLRDEAAIVISREYGVIENAAPGRIPPPATAALRDIGHLCHDGQGNLWAAVFDEVRVWDAQRRPAGNCRHQMGLGTPLTGKPHIDALAAGERWCVAACRDGSIDVLRLDTSGPAWVGGGALSRDKLVAAAVSPGGSTALVGTARGELVLAELPKGRKLSTRQAHDKGLAAIAGASNGLWASGDRSGAVRLWCRRGDELEGLLRLRHTGPVRDLQFHPDGVRLFVLIDGERAVRVYHLGRLRARLEAIGLGEGLGAVRAMPLPPAIKRPAPPVKAEPPRGTNGLKAETFVVTPGFGPTVVRYDDQIDVAWGSAGKEYQAANYYLLSRWTGWLRPPKAGRYVLSWRADERGRVWLDGDLVLESRLVDARTEVDLDDRPHELRVEAARGAHPGQARLWWGAAGEPLRPVESACLFYGRKAAEAARKSP